MNASGEPQSPGKGKQNTHSFDSSCSSTLRFLCTYRRARRGCHRIERGAGGRMRKVRGEGGENEKMRGWQRECRFERPTFLEFTVLSSCLMICLSCSEVVGLEERNRFPFSLFFLQLLPLSLSNCFDRYENHSSVLQSLFGIHCCSTYSRSS